LVPSTVKLLYQQTKKAQSVREVLCLAAMVICYDSCHAQLLAVTICVIWIVDFSVEVVFYA
jgi:hypothetical protein